MSKRNYSKFVFGALLGIGAAAVTAIGAKIFGTKKDEAPLTLVPEECYTPKYIQAQIDYVCRALNLEPADITSKFFPHIGEGRAFEPTDVSGLNASDIAKYIDHTVLKAMSSECDVLRLLTEAKRHEFASVCVNGGRVKFAKRHAPNVPVAAVVGFPLGQASIESKRYETEICFRDGATEIDMVVNVGKLLEGHYSYVFHDVKAVCAVDPSKCVKVILETCYLSPRDIVIGCVLCVLAGATFVKTSTGFGPNGATVPHVRLMKTVVGDRCKVKAAGGIRCLKDAKAMIQAGAERLGCSAGVKIVSGGVAKSSY